MDTLDHFSGDILALEEHVNALSDIRHRLQQKGMVDTGIALEADALTGGSDLVRLMFSSTPKIQKHGLALEGVTSRIWEAIKKFVKGVAAFLKRMWNSLFGKKDAGLNEEDVKKEEEKTAEFKTYAQAKEAEQTHAETAPETPRKSYVATYHERWASTFPDLQSKLSPIARVMLNESSARELDRFLAAFCEYGTWGHRFEESVRDGLEIYERYLTSAAENEPRYGSSEEERTKWEGEAKKQIDRQVSPHTVAAQAQVEELLGLLEKAAESTRSGSHSGLKLEIKKACDRVSEMYTQNRPTFRQASSSIRAVKVALPSLEERIADLERFFDKPQSGSTHLQEFVCREMMGFLKAAVKLLQSVGHAVQFVEKMWSEAKHLRHVVYLAAKDAYEYAAKETGHSRGSLDQDENDVRIDSNPADAKMAGWSLI